MATWTPPNSGSVVDADFGNTQSIGYSFYSGSNPVIGNVVTQATFRLFSSSTPGSFTISCRIYDSSGNLQETSTNTIDANLIPSGGAVYTFTFAGSHTIALQDYIAVTPGDSSFAVLMSMKNSGATSYSGCRQTAGSAPTFFSPERFPTDVTVTYSAPAPPPASGGTRLPPPPAFVRF